MSLFDKLRSGSGQNVPRPALASCAWTRGNRCGRLPMNVTKAGPGSKPLALCSEPLRLFQRPEGIPMPVGRNRSRPSADLGSARQTTITFFIERGFKVYTEDLLVTWKIFLDAEEKQWRELPPGAAGLEMTPAARAERFLGDHTGPSARYIRCRADMGSPGLP